MAILVAVRKIKRAQILLAADQGSTDEAIGSNVAVGTSTVYRTKLHFVEEVRLCERDAGRSMRS
jgi:hypothetical protein